jgi:two-component system chemotaxis sensor kinase CheA
VAGTVLDAVGDPQRILDPDGLVSEAQRGEPSTFEAPPPRSRALVVDDSSTPRMLERTILESAGYDVDVATPGEEAALASLRAERRAR